MSGCVCCSLLWPSLFLCNLIYVHQSQVSLSRWKIQSIFELLIQIKQLKYVLLWNLFAVTGCAICFLQWHRPDTSAPETYGKCKGFYSFLDMKLQEQRPSPLKSRGGWELGAPVWQPSLAGILLRVDQGERCQGCLKPRGGLAVAGDHRQGQYPFQVMPVFWGTIRWPSAWDQH